MPGISETISQVDNQNEAVLDSQISKCLILDLLYFQFEAYYRSIFHYIPTPLVIYSLLIIDLSYAAFNILEL